jgi:hypothetical protein
LFLILIFLVFSFSAQTNNDSTGTNITADTGPEYPGGMAELYKFLKVNLDFNSEKELQYCSKFFIKFRIDEKGKASHFDCEKTQCEFENMYEKVKLLEEKMPLWKPATSKGKPIQTYLNIPIRIHLK